MSPNPHSQPASRPDLSPVRSAAAPTARELLAELRRAVDLHLAGNYFASETRLRSVLKAEPMLPQAHHHLAVVLHAQRQFSDAVRHLSLAADLDPRLPGIQERLESYRLDAEGRRSA